MKEVSWLANDMKTASASLDIDVKERASEIYSGPPVYSLDEGSHLDITPSSTPACVRAELVSERLMGPAGMREIVLNTLVIVFYLVLLSIPFVSYAFVSGGMRWILVVAIVTSIGLYTVYVMNMGTQKKKWRYKKAEKQLFSGELSRVNEIVKRGKVGYNYSQFLMKEMIAEALIYKIRLGRGMSAREIEKSLDDPEAFIGIVGDEELARFILDNWKKAAGWSDKVSLRKSDKEKAESGRKFMLEVEHILAKAEAWE
ncbi:MAG: hypothetical protein KAS67_04695 [Thermoplasmata archaeon]|nr:hypothetical protein [Thermoplasmata archaeon]